VRLAQGTEVSGPLGRSSRRHSFFRQSFEQYLVEPCLPARSAAHAHHLRFGRTGAGELRYGMPPSSPAVRPSIARMRRSRCVIGSVRLDVLILFPTNPFHADTRRAILSANVSSRRATASSMGISATALRSAMCPRTGCRPRFLEPLAATSDLPNDARERHARQCDAETLAANRACGTDKDAEQERRVVGKGLPRSIGMIVEEDTDVFLAGACCLRVPLRNQRR
jgi:hypothetical protein